MAVGGSSNLGALSYVAIDRETTFGTAVTTTAALDPISFSVKTAKDNKILEQIERSRVMSKHIKMGKVIEGEMELYYTSQIDAHVYLLQNAFGGTVTSSTATGETAGGAAFDHDIRIGSMDQTYKSLTINSRKGDSTNGVVFEYSGVRINELGMTAELDEPLKLNCSMIAQDSTVGATDVESLLTANTAGPLHFAQGRLSVESSFASLTSTSFWHVQSFEFTLSNNLKSDNESRRIGSDILAVLPVGVATLQLTMTVRFDTTTAYDAMIADTKLSAEFEFLADTLTGSSIKEGLKVQMPVVYIKDAGEPEIGGPDEILSSQIVCDVLLDDSSASGYAVRAIATNLTSSY